MAFTNDTVASEDIVAARYAPSPHNLEGKEWILRGEPLPNDAAIGVAVTPDGRRVRLYPQQSKGILTFRQNGIEIKVPYTDVGRIESESYARNSKMFDIDPHHTQ